MKHTILLPVLLLFQWGANAQLPATNYFYYASSGATVMYNFNCATNTSTINSIALPSGNIGLAVNNNFFAGPAMTYWTVVGGNFTYYNGSTWVNTGHAAMAVNIGGAGPYIYSYNGSTGQIYRYNGTGPATLLVDLANGLGPYDVTGDASGNFFVMKTNSLPHTLSQYSPLGTLLTTYSMVGFPSGSAGGGFAFIDGKLYADISGTRVWGTISGTTITYGGALTLSISPGDFANWPLPIVPLPVELLSFTGEYDANIRRNVLNWSTSAEVNSDYFTVEFSDNGYEWNWLTDVTAAGNSNDQRDYSASHDSPFITTYYRLKQTDYDGEYQYYDPVTITRPSDDRLHLYPNPANTLLNIKSENEMDGYLITDETGKTVLQGTNQSDLHQIDISSIETGLYFFTTLTNGEVKNRKFIKN